MIVKNIVSTKSLFKDAKKSISHIKKGDTFVARDLFKGYEWNKLPIKGRMALATMIYKYAVTDGHKDIKPTGRTMLKQQIYKKR